MSLLPARLGNLRVMRPAFIFLLAAGMAAAGLVACYRSSGLSGNEFGTGPAMPSGQKPGAQKPGGQKSAIAYADGVVSKLAEQNFDADVLRSTQPVLVDFFATWCGPCKRMAPIVDEFARKHKSQFRVFECDIDQNHVLASRYGIDAVPTFMVFNKGTLVGRFTGSDTAETFESNIVSSLDTSR